MKNKLQLIILIMLTGLVTRAQIIGTHSIPGATYPTIASAIAALNVAGVGPGGVTFNIVAGYTETFTSTTDGLIKKGFGTAANPIVFQKSGTGANPVITAATPGTGGRDGIIFLRSATYVTFNGIDLQENPANIALGTQAALTEIGYGVVKAAADSGSQHITIQNCAISLYFFPNTLNFQSYAVYQRHLTTVPGSSFINPTVPAGTHSYNTYSGLTISNCQHGIYLEGSGTAPAPYTLYDQNNTVTGNTITLAGSNTTNTAGYAVYAVRTNNLTVTNNAVNGNVAYGNVYGYWIDGKAINVECSYNTFTLNYTGTVRAYGFAAGNPNEGTANVTNYHHNTVQNVTMAAGALAFYPMQFGVGAIFNVYDNVVSDVTIGSATVYSNTSFFGFAVFRNTLTGYSATMNVYNNQFKNINVLSLTPQTTNYQLFQFYDYNTAGDPAGPATNVYNNIIENVSIATTSTVDGILGYNNSAMIIRDNIIRGITSNGQINGIRLAGKEFNVVYQVYKNQISNLTSNGTNASARAVGICDWDNTSSAGTAYYYNNFISNLKAPQSISPDAVVGFYFAQANTSSYLFSHYLFNNTVYLDALSTSAGPFGSSGVYSASLKTLEMKNNIIVNISTHIGTGKTVALKYLGLLSPINYKQASNKNIFYAGAPGPDNLIFADDANSDQTLNTFKARVFPRDAASMTELPPFVNIVTAPYNLHLATNIPTQCESAGITVTTPVNITTDIDNDARYPNPGYPVNPSYPATAPDIGADEFGGLVNDVSPPAINFTPLLNTSLFTARTLTTSITDQTGVPTSGIGLPRLYWKINAGGSWNTSVATWVSGTTYTFTLGSGVALNDSVYYYIAAQDTKSPPIVGSAPPTGSGYTYNPPACSTPPSNSSCFSYKIVQGLCGTYTVGTGGDYPTITAAVASISGKHISCPVVFQLTDATYPSETFPINVLNYDIEGASAINTITVRPAPGVNATLSGTSSTALFKLTRTSYFILDGSNNGSSSRNLTISNTATTGTTAVIWIASTGIAAGTYGNVVKNCNIKNGYKTDGAYGIVIGSGTNVGAAGHDNDNLTIENNALSLASVAIYASSETAGLNDNLVIKNNIIGSANPASYIATRGIVLYGASGAQVTGNEIYNLVATVNAEKMGIELNSHLTNTLVKENKIHDFSVTAGLFGSSIGIMVTNVTVNNTTIVNNLIYNLTTSNYSATNLGLNPFGIRITGGTGHKLYHNTVRMTGTQAAGPSPNTAGTLSAAVLVSLAATITDMKDNILTNDIVGLTGSRSYCIYMDKTAGSWITSSNYNDLYPSGPYGLVGMYVPIVSTEINCPTLADWKTASGKDANSVSIDPVFASSTSLVPTTTLMPKAGIYIPTVPTDFANVNRTNPPDIGAYEFTISPIVVTVAASGVTNSSAVLNSSIDPKGVTVNSFFDYGLTTAYGTTVAGSPSSVTGTTPVPVSCNLTGLLPNTTYHYRARGIVNPGGLVAFGSDMTFTTPPLPPSVITTVATAATSSSATINGTVNANDGTTTVVFQYGLTTSYGNTVNAVPPTVTGNTVTPVSYGLTGLLPNTTYHYRVVGTSTGGTSNGNDMTFTTVAILANVVTNVATSITATGATLNGNVTANYANTSVTFQYGLTTAYGNTITATPATVTGGTATPVLANISGLSVNTLYHFRCVGTNLVGTAYGADYIFTTGCIDPVVTITGPASTCYQVPGYVYTTQPGMNNYVWSITGGTITAGAGTNSVTVTWNTLGAQTISVNYQNSYGCSAASPTVYNVTVNALPVVTITGPAVVCDQSTGNIYTTQAGNSNYQWSVNGGTITAGSGSNAITVTWTSAGAKTVSANYSNSNGCSAASPTVYNVTVNPLPVPTITGYNNICVNAGPSNYSTETGMSSYTWSVSAGGTIQGGQGTSTVTINWTVAGSQTVSVNYINSNGCTAATPTVYNVTVNPLPGAAGTITGTANVCGGAQGISYSVAAIANTTYYVWTLPAGAAIATGAGTNSITVNFDANASSGNITVYGNNICGNGATSPPFAVNVTGLPAAAGNITGPADVCQGTSGAVYTVGVIVNATGYNWTVPAGVAIVSGGGTNTITVDFGMNAVSGVITVYGTNSCGNGAASPDFNVTVNPIPVTPAITANGYELTSNAPAGNQWYFEGAPIAGATGQTYTVAQSGDYWCVVTLNGCSSDTSNHIYIIITGIEQAHGFGFSVYPVPNDGIFTISIKASLDETVSIKVYNNLGVHIYDKKDVKVYGRAEMKVDLRPLPGGIYTVLISNKNGQTIRKIIVK